MRSIKRKKWSAWIEWMVIFCVFAAIVIHAQNLSGYDTTVLSYESNMLVVNSSGYEVEENSFRYTGDVNSYVQISNVRSSDQMLIYFGQNASEDTKVWIFYTDEQGNVLDDPAEGIWQKGNPYAKINTRRGKYGSYLIKVEKDFVLQKVYYAADNGYTGPHKPMIFLVTLPLWGIFSFILISVKRIREWQYRWNDQVLQWGGRIISERKKYLKRAAIAAGCIAVCELLFYLGLVCFQIRFSWKTAVFSLLIGLLLYVIWSYWRYHRGQFELFAALVIVLVGSMISFLEPPNVGLSMDDEIHFSCASNLVHKFDHNFSVADSTIVIDYPTLAQHMGGYDRETQKKYTALLNELQRSGYYTDSLVGSPTINIAPAYIPSTIGLIVAKGIGLSYPMILAVGRWMNLLFVAVLAYLSMKRLRSGKMVVFLITMLPTVLFAAANYSYDPWLYAWSVYGLSIFLGEWQQPEKKMELKTGFLISVAMFFAILIKSVYFPLTLVAFFMPEKKFKNKKECWIYRGMILCAAILPFVIMYLINYAGRGMGTGDSRGGAEVDATAQMALVKSQPVQTLVVIFNFLKDYLNPLKEGKEFLTVKGYMSYGVIPSNVVLLLIIAGACMSREEKDVKFPWWTKVCAVLLYVAIGFVCAFSMYIVYTAVGLDTVSGCQGRYMVPVLFPTLFILTRYQGKTRVKQKLGEAGVHAIFLLAMAFVVASAIWVNCLFWY